MGVLLAVGLIVAMMGSCLMHDLGLPVGCATL